MGKKLANSLRAIHNSAIRSVSLIITYSNSILSWIVSVGSISMEMPSDAFLKRATVSFESSSTTRWDQFYFDAWAYNSPALTLNDWVLEYFHQDFVAVNKPYFTTDELPTIFDPTHFVDNRYLDLRFRSPDGNSTKYLRGLVDGGSVTTSGVATVPVPATLWLFGSAILGFSGFSRFKKKAD